MHFRVLTLHRDPTPGEALVIRECFGLRKRREYDEAAMAVLGDRGKALAALMAKQREGFPV